MNELFPLHPPSLRSTLSRDSSQTLLKTEASESGSVPRVSGAAVTSCDTRGLQTRDQFQKGQGVMPGKVWQAVATVLRPQRGAGFFLKACRHYWAPHPYSLSPFIFRVSWICPRQLWLLASQCAV